MILDVMIFIFYWVGGFRLGLGMVLFWYKSSKIQW